MKKIAVVLPILLMVAAACNLFNTTGVGDPDETMRSAISSAGADWHRASPPVSNDSLWYAPPAWKWYWFTPRDMDAAHHVRQDDIHVPEEALGSNYAPLLRMHVQPAPKQDTLAERFSRAWAGIMTNVAGAYTAMDSMAAIEFYCKVENGFNDKGKLYLQLGSFSEDISINGGPPNGKLDREDTSSAVIGQNYDKNLDNGLDRLSDTLEFYCVPGGRTGTWDTLRYGDPLLEGDSLDPSKDNFKQYYYESGDIGNYRYVCRTQLDGRLELGEDIDTNGVLRTRQDESYFEVVIDLSDSLSTLIDPDADLEHPGEWRKYRIPIPAVSGGNGVFTAVNNPRWSHIPEILLFWRDFPEQGLSEEYQLILYDIRFTLVLPEEE